MGWISDRHMQTGSTIGGMKGKKHKGPLRKVVERTYYGNSMFDYDSGVLECGHTNSRITMGAIRARCRQCAEMSSEDYKVVSTKRSTRSVASGYDGGRKVTR